MDRKLISEWQMEIENWRRRSGGPGVSPSFPLWGWDQGQWRRQAGGLGVSPSFSHQGWGGANGGPGLEGTHLE